MQDNLFNRLSSIQKENKKHKIRHKAVTALAGLVVFVTTYALILPAITMETGVYCGIEEHFEHSIDEGCYEEVTTLICTDDGSYHIHDESCYGTESILACGMEECEAHFHDESCYEPVQMYICGLEEDGDHTHSDDCNYTYYNLICELEETEGHTHSDECFIEQPVLICPLEEKEPHIHTDECYSTELVLVCERELHIHGLSCYSNPGADLEDAGIWANSVSKVRLTGNWNQDLISIAASQIGYTESINNYIVSDDGNVRGYNRYSAWYGTGYDDWSIHFVDFCINYAGVPIPTAGTGIDWIGALGTSYHASGNYVPVAGDLVFFDTDNDLLPDRMGIAAQVAVGEQGELTQLITIEGDALDAVNCCSYTGNSEMIMGYGELPQNPDYIYVNEEPAEEEPAEEEPAEEEPAEEEPAEEEPAEEVPAEEEPTEEEPTEEEPTEEEPTEEEPTEEEPTEEDPTEEQPTGEEPTEEELTEEEPAEEVPAEEDPTEEQPTGEEPTEEEPTEEEPTEEEPAEEVSTEEEPAEEEPAEEEPTGEEPAEEEPTGEEPTEEEPAGEEPAKEEPSDEEPSEEDEEAEEFEDEETEDEDSEDEDAEEPELLTLTFEGPDYIVTATFTAEAEIPEDADLWAFEYEKDTVDYTERYEMMSELYGWKESGFSGDVRIFNIGFYVLGIEVEPAAPVSITIKYFSAEAENDTDTEYEIIHFGEETQVLDAVWASEEDGKTISFETDSFSDFAVLALSDSGSRSVSEENLIAYFTFDNSTEELTGNARATIIGNASWSTDTEVSDFTNNGSLQLLGGSNAYLTITRADGSPLLTGYDEISYDFWIRVAGKYTFGNSDHCWPVFAAQNGNNISYLNENYVAVYCTTTEVTAERFGGGRSSDGSGSAASYTATENKWVHVRADYNKSSTVITLTDESGNVLAQNTSAASKSLTDILGTAGVLQVGKANWNSGEYFNGLIDELKIYGKSSNHICASNEIAHASFDGDSSSYWNETAEETGKATVDSHMNNSNNLDEKHLAPVDTTARVTHPASAYMQSSEQDYITIKGSGNSNLLKGKSYSAFTVDFWAQAVPGNSGNYGLFSIGSNDGGTYRQISAEISRTNTSDVILSYSGTGATVTIDCGQSLVTQEGRKIHYIMTFQYRSKDTYSATLYVFDENNDWIGSGTIVTPTYDAIFEKNNEVVEFGRGTYNKTSKTFNYFNGYMDDIKVYSTAITPTIIPDGTKHPQGAVTVDIDATGVMLINIDAGENLGQPKSGVTYTVYNPDGSVAGTYTTGSEYTLQLTGLTEGVEYTISQTAVPEGYTLSPQTMSFTIPTTADNVYEVGIFYDYCPAETYHSDKTAEVYDYANRIYDIEITSLSGDFDVSISNKNYMFVVDQSNSMLFPAALQDTGKTVDLAYANDKDSSTSDDAGGNSDRLDALGLDEDTVYYIVADETRTSTVFAIWKSSNGLWYYQDASYYCQAQMKVTRPDLSGTYQFADVGHGNNTAYVDGGGCINGIDRGGNGYTLVGTAFQKDYPDGTGTRNYKIYTGSQINRLTYLKYALKRLIYQLAAMGAENQVTITTFDQSLEACMTRTISQNHQQNIDDMIDFIDHIRTNGGTSQNFGLWHVVDNYPTGDYNKSGCNGGHLSSSMDNYVILVTDGALNGSDTVTKTGGNQEQDLYAAGDRIRQSGTLITIGLSVQDVELARKDLASTPTGIASPGFSYLDRDADALAMQLTNILLGETILLNGNDDTATITDYISDSFYVTDKYGSALAEGTWLTLAGEPVNAGDASAAGQLKRDSTGWYIEWKDQFLPANAAGAEPWRGRVYVKAKEDFIGGNTIDTNKSASLYMNDKPEGSIELETPTVNVRLLPMNRVNSEETIFLSDGISVQEKVKLLFEQLRFTKIVTNGDDVHNKYNASDAEGLEDAVFTPEYAAGSLSDSQWATLLAGGSITIPYTYDDASSHGAVGYFTISLEKTGDGSSLTPHSSTQTGYGVESYTWRVEFTAERIENGSRPENVHNRGNGPGTEVGSVSDTALEAGYGTVTSLDSHVVNVVDGKLTVIKSIHESLYDSEASQAYTFTLYKLDTDGEYKEYRTGDDGKITVVIPAEQSSANVTVGGLPRGTYKLVETADELYHVEQMDTVQDKTNCSNETQSKTELTFTIGTGKDGNDVIIHNSGSGFMTVYSSLSADYDTGVCEGVSYETTEVLNKKTEYKAELTVTKYWRGVPEDRYSTLNVYVILCKDGVIQTDENGSARAIILNAGNNWSGSFEIPLSDGEEKLPDLGYSVLELGNVTLEMLDGKSAAVVENLDPAVTVYYLKAADTGLVLIGNDYYSVETGTDPESEEYSLYVLNGESYHLPDSGGIGKTPYTMGGLLLMGVSLLIGLTAVVKRRREGRVTS